MRPRRPGIPQVILYLSDLELNVFQCTSLRNLKKSLGKITTSRRFERGSRCLSLVGCLNRSRARNRKITDL